MKPRVSVIIPTRDGGTRLLTVVAAVLGQDLPEPFELLLVDSGSRDGTIELLRKGPARVIDVPGASFNHGATRNYAIGMSQGEIAVLLVQDAVPANASWLGHLVAAMDADPEAAGAYSRQIPRPEHPAFVRRPLENWVTGSDRPRVQKLSREDYERMSPAERQAAVTFDDVSSAIRRSVWRRHPLPKMSFAEDLVWSRRVLLDGHHIRYVPESAVIHSHDRGGWYELRRTYVCHRTLNELFGTCLVPDRRTLLAGIGAAGRSNRSLVREDTVSGLRRLLLLWRATVCGAASVLGQYLGPRATPTRDRWLGRGV